MCCFRPDLEKLRDEMSHLGATVVTTEADVRDAIGEQRHLSCEYLALPTHKGKVTGIL